MAPLASPGYAYDQTLYKVSRDATRPLQLYSPIKTPYEIKRIGNQSSARASLRKDCFRSSSWHKTVSLFPSYEPKWILFQDDSTLVGSKITFRFHVTQKQIVMHATQRCLYNSESCSLILF